MLSLGVTIGLVSLLGASLAFLIPESEIRISSSSAEDDILRNSRSFRERYEIESEDSKAYVPPISSSEASRPKSSIKYKAYGLDDADEVNGGSSSQDDSRLKGFAMSGVLMNSLFGDGNWVLLLAVLGGAYLSYKVLGD